MSDFRRDLNDQINQRTTRLEAAAAALEANDQAGYEAAMEDVRNFNGSIERLQDMIREQDRKVLTAPAPTAAEQRDMAEERGSALMNGGRVRFSTDEVRRVVMNQVTVATETLVEPTGAGRDIRDPLGNVVSSIVDQVYVQNLTGMGAYLEPYVITEIEADGGKVKSRAGTKRTASTDPTFGVAKISPYELNVTQYVDRNISRLSPADYYAKVYNMAMRAMRRKLAGLIVNGDGQASPDMFGIKNAKNVAGNAIFGTVNVSGVDETLLDSLFFAYGSDEAIGPNARLYLTKADLQAIGMVRNANKERVFKIRPEGGNPNVGTIEDGGTIIPYTIVSGLTSLSGSTAGSSAIQTMLYGDPMNYELGLFGDFTVRVDESIKGEERMLTILGDAMVGGNLVVDKGFVVATVPST